LVAAGCGGGGGSGASSSSGGGGMKSSGSVAVRSSDLGNILVDGSGRTVYLFEKDRGTRSECSGACAKAWPPVTVSGRPTGGGVGVERVVAARRQRLDVARRRADHRRVVGAQGDRRHVDGHAEGADAVAQRSVGRHPATDGQPIEPRLLQRALDAPRELLDDR